jgi:hypothetical protein
MKKTPTDKHEFFVTHRSGEHWAKLTIEWSDTARHNGSNRERAEAAADHAFGAAMMKVRPIVDALKGKW